MREYIQVKSSDPPIITPWLAPSDWIDISNVGNNEINLLITEGAGIGFIVKVGTGTGTYSIDWGDGTVENVLLGDGTTVRQHQHTINGTPCSLGYNTWKIRIYDASTNITIWKVAKHTFTNRPQNHPILSVNFGTQGITDYSNTFYSNNITCKILKKCNISSFVSVTNTNQMFYNCYALVSITLPESWGSVTNANSMFYFCYSLSSITMPTTWGLVTNPSHMFNSCFCIDHVTLPSSWSSVNDASSMFAYCYSLSTVTIPNSFGNISNTSYMFYACNALCYISIPTSWGLVDNVTNMFSSCGSLASIILPGSWGSVTNTSSMFNYCTSLKTITNIQYLGSLTVQSDFTDFMKECEFVQQNITINSRLSKIGIYGASGYILKVPSIRLTNSGSTFNGGSPQINISYTSLGQAALVLLFGDLPTLTSKTINITGCTGSAALTAPERAIATNKGWTIIG